MNIKPSLYIESTIPSYLTARPSNNLTNQYRQFLTKKWWDTMHDDFSLYTSDYTIDECKEGHPDAAQRRLEFLKGITRIQTTKDVETLAIKYIKLLSIPDRSKLDAFHLAICVVNQIDYLLSWNCTHLGAFAGTAIAVYNEKNGLFVPILTSPETFIEVGGIDDET